MKVESNYFFDKGSDQSPVVHFWSLSIEEQFYLIFPSFLLVLSVIFKHKTLLLLIFFSGFTILFAVVNAELFEYSEMTSYYSTMGRFYQFGLGT